MTGQARVTAIVLTKNEELALKKCLDSLSFCDQVIVCDSLSTDETRQIAKDCGAEVVDFVWNGKYPKKKQWGMSLPQVRNNWVLHIDADERVTTELAAEISDVVSSPADENARAFDLPIAYHFLGRELRHGHRVTKRALVDRRYSRFPDVGDEGAPGITEVEGHYQPIVDGPIGKISAKLEHDDPGAVREWIARHNRYSDWEAHLRANPALKARIAAARSNQGRRFDRLPFKPLVFFAYSYILKRGFLDGAAGFYYALNLAVYYSQIDMKFREISHRRDAP